MAFQRIHQHLPRLRLFETDRRSSLRQRRSFASFNFIEDKKTSEENVYFKKQEEEILARMLEKDPSLDPRYSAPSHQLELYNDLSLVWNDRAAASAHGRGRPRLQEQRIQEDRITGDMMSLRQINAILAPRFVPRVSARAFSTSSFLQSRLQTIRDRAARQHIEWIRATTPIKNANRTDTTTYRERCKLPFKLPEPPRDQEHEGDELLDDISAGKYQGKLEEMTLEHFGSITAEHGDVLNEAADCLLVPIPANLAPHRGFAMKVLELGGRKLIKALVHRSKLVVAERIKHVEAMESSFNDREERKAAMLEAETLQIGTPAAQLRRRDSDAHVRGREGDAAGVHDHPGNAREAALKLRRTVKKALDHLNALKISTVLTTHVGESLLGYRPKDGCEIMVEEAYDCILQVARGTLQIEHPVPQYSLKAVRFVDSDAETARAFAHAVFKMRQEKLPEFQVRPHDTQVVPAPVYHSRKTARIIEVDESVLKFSSQYRKITYKRHSVVRRSKRLHYLRNLKPFMWRPGRLYEPPPFLLRRISGLPSAFQLPPRPYYKKGFPRELFPFYGRGVKGLRMSRAGTWVGAPKPEDIYTANLRHR